MQPLLQPHGEHCANRQCHRTYPLQRNLFEFVSFASVCRWNLEWQMDVSKKKGPPAQLKVSTNLCLNSTYHSWMKVWSLKVNCPHNLMTTCFSTPSSGESLHRIVRGRSRTLGQRQLRGRSRRPRERTRIRLWARTTPTRRPYQWRAPITTSRMLPTLHHQRTQDCHQAFVSVNGSAKSTLKKRKENDLLHKIQRLKIITVMDTKERRW